MRIVLIYTNRDRWPLGMRSVSAVLKKAGHHTRIILMGSSSEFYSRQTLREVKDLVKDSDIIGISCLSRGFGKAKQVIKCLRSLKKLIIWGGIHATMVPEQCVESADIVCRGEGEGMMLELVERLEEGRDWKDMANAAYKDNGGIVLNPLRPLISNLDELPLVDFSCEDEFHLTNRGFVQVSHVDDLPSSQPGEMVFIGSRGCLFQCTYCINAKLKELFSGKGRYFRKMSISKYIERIRALKQLLPKTKYIWLIDDDFFARSVDELREFSEEFPKQVGFPFECETSPMDITQEKMDLLVKAGLWRIKMGIESGSERTKKEVYKRYMSNEAVMRASRIISGYPQVVVYYFFIISNPYEQREDLTQTARLILDIPRPFYVIIYNLVFYPGTVLYDRAVRDGLIEGSRDSGYELDTRGGLQYKKHVWKSKNLFLNGLLFLMEGRSNRYRLGLLPRSLVPALLHPKVVDFGEKHPATIKGMISLKMFTLFLRKHGARCLKLLLSDPTSVYNLGKFFKK